MKAFMIKFVNYRILLDQVAVQKKPGYCPWYQGPDKCIRHDICVDFGVSSWFRSHCDCQKPIHSIPFLLSRLAGTQSQQRYIR
jgi:hypothetical protein